MSEELKIIPKLIFVPQRELVKLGNRWIIYLPMDMNELWEVIKRLGKKVRIYLEVIDDKS